MTTLAPPFTSLYYTDCVPGQGLAGSAGFQFQARSADPGSGVEAVAIQRCLYEVPSRWLRDRVPVESYPPSLAHTATEGAFLTSGGCYLGREAKGHREGNHFTHVVITRDPSSYGPVRPAQLWAAPWWARAPAPTTTCPPAAAPPRPGPWDVPTVRDHVVRSPRGADRLLALVSAFAALRGPGRRRILIIAADGSAAAGWIAAGTLLLERARSLRISFKLFCLDPDRTPHDVLVVHPDWAAPFERDDDYVVLDLRHDRVPAVATSEEAEFWVPRFLTDDPLDVVDAVELAGQLALETSGGVPGEIERDAAVLALGIDGVTGSSRDRAVARWLVAAPSTVVDLVGAPIVETLARSAQDHPTLAALDAVAAGRIAGDRDAHDLGWPPVATAVRRRLFDVEYQEARAGRGVAVAAPVLPVPGAGTADDLGALEALGRREPEAAMMLAHRHAIRPTDVMIARFTAWWADHPRRDPGVTDWACATEVLRVLCVELERRLAEPRSAGTTSADVRAHWWARPWELWRRLPLLEGEGPRLGLHRLDVEVVRAAFTAGGPARVTVLATAATRAHVPEGKGWVGAWDVVFPREGPTVGTGDVRRFVRAVPPREITVELARIAYDHLRRGPYDDDAAEATTALEDAGWSPEKAGVQDYPPSDPAVDEVVTRLVQGADSTAVGRLTRRLSAAKHPTRADRQRLLHAVLLAPPVVAAPVLRRKDELREEIRRSVRRAAAGAGGAAPDPRAFALQFALWLQDTRNPEKFLNRAPDELVAVLFRLDDDARADALEHLLTGRRHPLDNEPARLWTLWLQGEGLPLPGQEPPRRTSGPAEPTPADQADGARRWRITLPWKKG